MIGAVFKSRGVQTTVKQNGATVSRDSSNTLNKCGRGCYNSNMSPFNKKSDYTIKIDMDSKQIHQIDIEKKACNRTASSKEPHVKDTIEKTNDVLFWTFIAPLPLAIISPLLGIGSTLIGASYLGKETRLTHALIDQHSKMQKLETMKAKYDQLVEYKKKLNEKIKELNDEAVQIIPPEHAFGKKKLNREYQENLARIKRNKAPIKQQKKLATKELAKMKKAIEKREQKQEERETRFETVKQTYQTFMEKKYCTGNKANYIEEDALIL